MEGNASVYQVNPVSRTTGEGRAEFSRAWGPGFEQEGAEVDANYFFRGDRDFVRSLVSFRSQYGIPGTGFFRSNRFVRAPSSGGGSNAPHRALSVPHLDVSTDRG